MKKQELKKLRALTVAQLQAKLAELSMTLAKARLEKSAGKLGDVRAVSKLSDDRARILSLIKAQEQLPETKNNKGQK